MAEQKPMTRDEAKTAWLKKDDDQYQAERTGKYDQARTCHDDKKAIIARYHRENGR